MNILCKIFRSYISGRLERKKQIRKQMIDECRSALSDMRYSIYDMIADKAIRPTDKESLKYVADSAYAKMSYIVRKRIEKLYIEL